MVNVRIARNNPNNNSLSNQWVSVASVSERMALLYEDFKQGRRSLGSCQDMLASWALQAPADYVDRPFSVYVNIHGPTPSCFFSPTWSTVR